MDRPASADAGTEQTHRASVYLTNGVFLYRVVRFVPSATGEMVELEDCYGLDVVRVRVADVRDRRLRIVIPGSPRPAPASH